MLRAQFCILHTTLLCFLASEPFSSESATYSRPNRVFHPAFVRVHVFSHISMHVLHISRICTHLHTFLNKFSYSGLNFQVKGLKGFVRIGSEIAFVTSNCALFLKDHSSQPNWIFSKSSETLLQTLAQSPWIWKHELCTFSEGPEQPARLDFSCLLNPCSQPLLWTCLKPFPEPLLATP